MMNRNLVVTALVAFLIAFIAAMAMQREQAPAVTQVTDDVALQAELTMAVSYTHLTLPTIYSV